MNSIKIIKDEVELFTNFPDLSRMVRSTADPSPMIMTMTMIIMTTTMIIIRYHLFPDFPKMVRSTAGPPPSPFSPADWLAGSAATQRDSEGW